MARLPLAALLLCATLHASAAVVTEPVSLAPGAAGAWAGAIATQFQSPTPDFSSLVPVLAGMQKLSPLDSGSQATLAPVIQAVQTEVGRISVLKPETLKPAELAATAEKVKLAHALFWAYVPPEQQRWLAEADAVYDKRLGFFKRRETAKRMDAIIKEVFATSEGMDGSHPVFAGEGVKTMPAEWSLQAAPKMTALRDIPASELPRVKAETIAAADAMYREAQAAKTGGIFPIDPRLFDGIRQHDAETGLSSVYRDSKGSIVGFALAYVDLERRVAHLEKLGVVKEQRRGGLSKKMIHALALRAKELGLPAVELLVVKINDNAIAAYEKMGFRNETPEEALHDPRYNAYLYVAKTDVLIAKTTP